MNNLDGTDFTLLWGLVLTLVIGFMASFFKVRSSTKRGFMIMLFIAGVIMMVGATIAKSSSDKSDYQKLFDSTNTALTKVNENLNASDSIMELSNDGIARLQDIKVKNLQLQKQALAINEKSSQIQKSSELLNKKLREEIAIQKQTNKSASDILSSIAERDRNEKIFNQYRFVMDLKMLSKTNLMLYDGLQVNTTDYAAKFSALGREIKGLNKQLNDELQKTIDNPSGQNSYSKYLNDLANKIELQDKMLDSIDNTMWAQLENKKRMQYIAKDSVSAIRGIKNFLENSYGMLNKEMTNPFLLTVKGLVELWVSYYNEIQNKLQNFYIDKATLYDTKHILELFKAHDDFINKVEKFKGTTQVAIPIK